MKKFIKGILNRIRAEFQPPVGVVDPALFETMKMAKKDHVLVVGRIIIFENDLWEVTSATVEGVVIIERRLFVPAPGRGVLAIQYFLPLEFREEFIGDLYEIYSNLIRKGHPRIEMRIIISGHLVSIFWHALRFRLPDFFRQRRQS